jgi:hypothetical protein
MIVLSTLGVARPTVAMLEGQVPPVQSADKGVVVVGQPWTGGMGVTETTAQIMARQAAKDASGFVEPPVIQYQRELDYALPTDPSGPAVAHTGFVPNALQRSLDAYLPQTVGVNFKANQYGNSVPPDTQGAVGPTQFFSADNNRLKTFSKTTGSADPALNVTLNTFFGSVNGGASTFDETARYDRLSQRFIVTAEDGNTPNKIYIAISNAATITSATAWTFYSFDISTVTPAGDNTCFGDYPTTGVDANALIIGVNNFCPSAYASSAVFVVRKSSILSGGPIVVTAFRNVGQVTPRGVDSLDPDPSGTAPSYFISVATTAQLRLRRISDPAGTPTLSGNLNVTVPTVAAPIALEHLGNAHPGGTFNGKIDASDLRFMPVIKRDGVLWAAHGVAVNSSGVATAGDRDAVRWYQINNLDTTPTLAQSGTIFDPAASNPRSYTYGTVMVSGQGHAAFGFSVIAPDNYNSAGHTGRLANDTAGFTNTPITYTSGVGAYNAFDLGTSRAQRWGDYSRTSLDPCDDMTIWTVQEFTAQANTPGSSNSQWGIQVAQLLAPPPVTPTLSSPSSVAVGLPNVSVLITGTSVNGSGFYNTPSSITDACRKVISATVSGGVTVNSITYTDPTHVTLNISTMGATSGLQTVTIANPDSQTASAAILQVNAANSSNTALASAPNPSVFGQSVTFTATVSGAGAPTGSVTFYDDGPLLGSGTLSGSLASYNTGALTAGTHNITATYSGDGNFNPSTAPILAQVVNPVSTTTALASSSSLSLVGQSVTFTATVNVVAPGAGAPTGSVMFHGDGASLGSSALSGNVATYSTSALTIGTHIITATYSGGINFETSASNALAFTVNPYRVYLPIVIR